MRSMVEGAPRRSGICPLSRLTPTAPPFRRGASDSASSRPAAARPYPSPERGGGTARSAVGGDAGRSAATWIDEAHR